jgi:predicted MFS family arabinose efflux permease
LVLATIATQASIVVLAPLIVAIGRDLDASLSAVGLSRSIMAAMAVVVSLSIGSLIDRVGVAPLIRAGALLAVVGAGLSALAPSLAFFFAAQVVTGAGVGCLLSAGFAGVGAYFDEAHAAWAVGWVVGAQAIAWIVGNPVIGLLAEEGSWRLGYLVPASVAALAFLAGLMAPRGRTAGDARGGLGAVFSDRSARRWALAELVAFSAWTAEITYAGAFYIESYGLDVSEVGLLLAAGSIVFLVSSTNAARLSERLPRRRLIVITALAMGILLVPLLNLTPSVWFTLAVFCAMAFFASLRTTAASTLGLDQLPGQPGAMMGARTASAQLGYMIGAGAGGAVLALADFGALGIVLFGGMALSALLIARVSDPQPVPN